MNKILETYDADAIRCLFEEEGVLPALAARGFHDFDVTVEGNGGLPCARISARKQGRRWLLLQASVTEYVVQPAFFRARGYPLDRPIKLALVYWLREEDPTASFNANRPPLPLQRHPGLGVLRSAFHVVAHAARDRGLDGVACIPKFFHDAAIFFRSRLFLFLAAEEQGCFEALLRDLGHLPLVIASTNIATGAVCDADGATVFWSPGLQVCPISPELTAYFHSPHYGDQVCVAYETSRFASASANVSAAAGARTAA